MTKKKVEASEIDDMITKPDGYYSNKRLEMTGFIPKSSKKVLDCGCGEGYFGAEVKKQFLSCNIEDATPAVLLNMATLFYNA